MLELKHPGVYAMSGGRCFRFGEAYAWASGVSTAVDTSSSPPCGSSESTLAGLENGLLSWQLDLRPLLEEYFFGDREGLESAEAEWRRALLEAEDETQEDGDEDPLASP